MAKPEPRAATTSFARADNPLAESSIRADAKNLLQGPSRDEWCRQQHSGWQLQRGLQPTMKEAEIKR